MTYSRTPSWKSHRVHPGSKLHYSIDVLMAIPLTFLVYGNPAIAMCASEWAGNLHESSEAASRHRVEPDLGVVAVEPCCFPFGYLSSRRVIFKTATNKPTAVVHLRLGKKSGLKSEICRKARQNGREVLLATA